MAAGLGLYGRASAAWVRLGVNVGTCWGRPTLHGIRDTRWIARWTVCCSTYSRGTPSACPSDAADRGDYAEHEPAQCRASVSKDTVSRITDAVVGRGRGGRHGLCRVCTWRSSSTRASSKFVTGRSGNHPFSLWHRAGFLPRNGVSSWAACPTRALVVIGAGVFSLVDVAVAVRAGVETAASDSCTGPTPAVVSHNDRVARLSEESRFMGKVARGRCGWE